LLFTELTEELGWSKRKAVDIIKGFGNGYERICLKTIQRFVEKTSSNFEVEMKRRGPDFENTVLDHLIVTQIDSNNEFGDTNKIKIIANVMFSYACILHAAKIVQARPEWANVEDVKELKFSLKWIH